MGFGSLINSWYSGISNWVNWNFRTISRSTVVETHIDIVTADHLPNGHLVTETVGWLIRVHWHVHYISGVVGGEDAGNRTGQGAPTVCVCVRAHTHTRTLLQ